MIGFLNFVLVITSFALIIAILMQSGKGSGIGDIFGGGATQSLLGTSGGKNILTRATYILFGVFLATTLLLAILPHQTVTSQLQNELKSEFMVTPTSATASNTPIPLPQH